MKDFSTTYTVPELITLRTKSFDMAPPFKPEITRLDQGSSGGQNTRYLYPYRLCYLDRKSVFPSTTSHKERLKVNLSSLCVKRVSLIKSVVKGLLEGHRGIPNFNKIEKILDWIDLDGRSMELYNTEGIQNLYRDYTDALRHRLRLSNVGKDSNSMSYPSAHQLQAALSYICSLIGYDLAVVKTWAVQIPQKKVGLNELPAPKVTTEEHAIAYALHKRFFEAFSQTVLNNIAPPVVVDLADLGFEDLIFYHQFANNAHGWSASSGATRTDWQPFFYQRNGVFGGKPKEFNALLADHGIAPIKTNGFKRKQDNNLHFNEATLRELANHATRHFGYLLIAESGSNAAHLSSIDCQKIRLEKAVGLATTRAVKGRAGFERQEQHVDLRFAQTTWRQYVRLRDWMNQQLDDPPEFGLFLLGDRSDREPYTLLSTISLRPLPLWPAKAPSLATREARKHKIVNLVEGSGGNISVAADIQSVTPRTVERHYAFKNVQEAAKVMNSYFSVQAKSAELRRIGVRPVRISVEGESTHAGVCDAVKDGPKLIEGLEGIAIEPRCGAPATCIFCAYFCLHADVGDILRLLTIKLWVEVQSRLNSINIDEHFQKFTPYLNRIQQILDDLSSMDGEIPKLVKNAISRLERGDRDPYWNAKINALLELEGI